MNEEQIKRSLQSIGVTCFVKYFEAFSDLRKVDLDLIDAFMKIEGWEESGAKTRVSQSRRIFREGCEMLALKLAAQSKNVSPWVVAKAKELSASST
ncbi:hypothetical protein [uncultured Microbulbifer sp.]|uniref:hypothetical protein n=1 Tax=uncultured Microbulbifer sp. TaxID=348147 RepID=UPI0025FBE77E|nr:hypothetical protein [uncultured Microbulbifer sp.]